MPIHLCTFCKHGFSVERSGEYLCPHCQQRQAVQVDAAQPASTHALLPWEDRKRNGFFHAAAQTWAAVTLRPREFYRALHPSERVSDALLWAGFFGSVGFIANYFANDAMQRIAGHFVKQPEPKLPADFANHPIFMGLFVIFGAPLFVLAAVLVQSIVVHLSLMMVGARRYPLEATLKVVAYAQAPLILAVFPVLGGFGAAIWSIVLIIVGCKEVHQTTTAKVALAWFLPLILCCCLAVGLSVLGVVALAPLLKQLLEQMPR